MFNVSPQMIIKVLTLHNIPLQEKKRKYIYPPDNIIFDTYFKCKSVIKTSDILDINPSYISKLLSKNKINPIGITRYSVGDKVGKLTILDITNPTLTNKRKFTCRCECGNTIVLRQGDFYGNKTINCGCERIKPIRGKKKLDDKTKYDILYKKADELGILTDRLIESLDNKKFGSVQQKIRVIKSRNINGVKRPIIRKLIIAGILPENLDNLNEEQTLILQEANTTKLHPHTFINKHLNLANTSTKQKYIHLQLLRKSRHPSFIERGKQINLKPEDIIINEYCPFFNTKLDYTPKKLGPITKYEYSIDRIDNSKGYVKGNVWVISRLANVIKLNSTLPELKTFCDNVLKIIGPKYYSKNI